MAHTFNGLTKRIIIDSTLPDVDVKGLYSDWKEWVLQSDNLKYPQAFRSFGGDPTSQGQYAPAYYFLMNGWRIVVDGFSATFSFNLYTEENDKPVLTYNNGTAYINNSDIPQYNATSAGFDYDALAAAIGQNLTVSVDAEQIADEVETRFPIINQHTTSEIDNIQTSLDAVSSDISNIQSTMTACCDKIDEIHHANFGRWFIDTANNQLVIYQQDGTTEVARFNLFDQNGNPTNSAATFDKVPV
jgi:hypothetical protein